MSISRCTWALSVLAALSLGGCALEPYESDQDEGAVGAAAWDLSHEGDEEPAGPEDGEDDGAFGGEDDDGTFNGEDGPEHLGEEEGEEQNPYERLDEVVGPHPDPWEDWRLAETSGTGNKDD